MHAKLPKKPAPIVQLTAAYSEQAPHFNRREQADHDTEATAQSAAQRNHSPECLRFFEPARPVCAGSQMPQQISKLPISMQTISNGIGQVGGLPATVSPQAGFPRTAHAAPHNKTL